MNKIKNEVALMFSGGIDSLLSAVLLQKKFDRVHLITFDKGYLEFGLKKNKANIKKLKEIFGKDKFIDRIIDIKDLTKNITSKSLTRDFMEYGSEVAWCVGCRLSMNIGALIYSLEKNLCGFADGSNKEQVPGKANLVATAENFPKVISHLREFAESYGMKFLTPVYNFGSREKKRKKLMEFGLEIDYLSKDHSKKIKDLFTKDIFSRSQPICVSGWLIHWKRNLLAIPVKHDEEKTKKYILEKQEFVIKDYIKNYFIKKQINIAELVRKRKEAHIE